MRALVKYREGLCNYRQLTRQDLVDKDNVGSFVSLVLNTALQETGYFSAIPASWTKGLRLIREPLLVSLCAKVLAPWSAWA